MKDTHYAYCVARLRANEKYMLSMPQMMKLCELKSLDDALDELLSSGWIKEKGSISQCIDRQNRDLWTLLQESVPDKKALDVLCVLNDYFNIKVAVKSYFTKDNADEFYIYPTTLNLKELTDKISRHNFSAIGGKKGQSAAEAYEAACLTENGQSAEVIIDRAAIDCLCEYAKDRKNGLVGEICAFLCDTTNIKIALRINRIGKNRDFAETAIGTCVNIDRDKLINKCLAEGDELFDFLSNTGYKDGAELFRHSSVYFDKWCDDKIIDIASKAKYTAFGFDPVCAYYYAKLNEIKSVRIILSGKLSGLDADIIKERVRALYV